MATIHDPIRIRNLELPNRFYASPMISNIVREDCCAGQQLLDATYHRARGGWGLYSVEGSLPTPDTKLFPRMLGCYDMSQVIALNEMVELIHAGGAKAMMQVTHPGRMANPEQIPKSAPPYAVAPSDTTPPNPFPPFNKPKGMTEADIEKLIGEYVNSAKIAQAAGFDMYELHCSHGTLPQQFMSPYTNHRTDAWGGDWERRTRFVCTILRRIREAVGDMPIAARVAGDEFMEGGYDIDDFCREIAPRMVAAGVDMFDVTCGIFEHFHTITPEIYEPHGLWVYLAERVKAATGVVVAGVGRINDGPYAERLIAEGRVDIVGIGRASLADPEFARKTLEGRHGDIRRCISCNTCLEADFSNRPSYCAVNFEYNRAAQWWEVNMPPARPAKRIMVVGGGPAGMEFARVARLRGHQVEIYDKAQRLGGYLPLAAALPRLNVHDVNNISRWLRQELLRLDVKVHLGEAVTPDLVRAVKPDLVVLATGAKEVVPAIPGMDAPEVGTLDEYLTGTKRPGKRVAIIGGHYGAEYAVSLGRVGRAEPERYVKYHRPGADRLLKITDEAKAHEVTLIEEGEALAFPPYFQMLRWMVVNEFLVESGVRCWTKTKALGFAGGRLTVETDGVKKELDVDSVVLALPRVGDRDLAVQLAGSGVAVREIGDCTGPKRVEKATTMANFLARQV